jgi:hypothetical protein
MRNGEFYMERGFWITIGITITIVLVYLIGRPHKRWFGTSLCVPTPRRPAAATGLLGRI